MTAQRGSSDRENIDPLVPARLRGYYMRPTLLAAEGGALTVAEVAERVGVSQREIDTRRQSNAMFAICIASSEVYGDTYVYPAWQIGLEGFDQILVLASQGETSGLTDFGLIAFMLNHNAWLDGRRPLDALRQGNIEQVKHAVAMYGEHCAV